MKKSEPSDPFHIGHYADHFCVKNIGHLRRALHNILDSAQNITFVRRTAAQKNQHRDKRRNYAKTSSFHSFLRFVFVKKLDQTVNFFNTAVIFLQHKSHFDALRVLDANLHKKLFF
jgi:hypothetical protein